MRDTCTPSYLALGRGNYISYSNIPSRCHSVSRKSHSLTISKTFIPNAVLDRSLRVHKANNEVRGYDNCLPLVGCDTEREALLRNLPLVISNRLAHLL
jgi:hypothetical protein